MDKLSDVELELAAVLMRMLWIKNSFIFEDKFKDTESLVRTTKTTLDDFRDVQGNEKGQEFSVSNEARGGERANHRWIKPIQGFIKANWDASLSKYSLGLDIVLRDDKGDIIACACYKRNPVQDLVEAEIVALWYAVKLCNSLGFNRVILEGDAEVVVKAVHSEEENLSSIGHVIEDVKIVLKERRAWRVQHVQREGNKVAHLLAKNSFKFDQEMIWVEQCPEFISLQVLKMQIVSRRHVDRYILKTE
ncbi:hypothetical protein F2P56_002746 [Juglans regia]|uniref:RNase H type-1 domain-containing protein n=2 Tax=Juglans regia TaxID=51240 RepID=A0A834D9W1_JUGRE|nr:uncharacterized protein LOC109006208 [Juglans regia]KAF5482155.1 hypothetical protein F2P56_002746 [Juglans regia]